MSLCEVLLRYRPAKSDRWWNTRWDTNGRHHGHPGHRGTHAAHAGGGPRVRVAVLDGPIDLDHPCFAGADLRPLATLVGGPATDGRMSRHGTHVASVILGRADGPVPGPAPGATGMVCAWGRSYDFGTEARRDTFKLLS